MDAKQHNTLPLAKNIEKHTIMYLTKTKN